MPPDQVTETPAATPAPITAPAAAPIASPAPAAGSSAAPSASPKDPPAAATPAPGTSPSELEIAFPKDVQVNKARLDAFKALAKEHGFSSKQAQALADWNLSQIRADTAADAKAWEQQKATWVEELKADKDFGGANYDKNLDFANKAIRQFGGDAAVKRFADLGVSFDPMFVKTFAAIGKAIGDDRLDVGSPNSTEATGREAELRSLFPKSYDQMTQKSA